MLQLVHLVADVITDLNCLIVVDLELFTASILKDGLAGLVRALDLLAPLFMFFYLREEDQIFTTVAVHFYDLEELL